MYDRLPFTARIYISVDYSIHSMLVPLMTRPQLNHSRSFSECMHKASINIRAVDCVCAEIWQTTALRGMYLRPGMQPHCWAPFTSCKKLVTMLKLKNLPVQRPMKALPCAHFDLCADRGCLLLLYQLGKAR